MALIDKMTKKEAARLGGLARQAKYGDLGTLEGRRLGGLRSQVTHKKYKTGFNTLKNVRIPRHSSKLAELCGILAGDGHIDTYQISMTTNAVTDFQHAEYVQNLFQNLFHCSTTKVRRKTSNAVVVVLSSKKASDFFYEQGLTRGNKVKEQLEVPLWVQKNKKFSSAFARGLFDTDGSIYVDSHTISGKIYKNIGLAFTNRSIPLLSFFKRNLENLGLHPTQKTKYIVFLRRESEICRYFELVGSSNQKHLGKLEAYLTQKGRVPKRS